MAKFTLGWQQYWQFPQIWRFMVSGCMVMAIAIATTGCSLESFKTTSTQVPQIVYSTISEPKTFNPVTNDVATVIFDLAFDTLLSIDGNTGELQPALAEDWTISTDQKEIIFTVRPGLQWSDGAPLTVDDILFTYNDVLFNDAIPSGGKDVLRIGEQGLFPVVTKVSDRQVKFTVPEPFAPFLRSAGRVPILPEHVLAEVVKTLDSDGNSQFLSTWGTDTDPNEIIGNGPYRITRYVPGERLILEKNPYYWQVDDQQQSQPYIERFIIQMVESSDSELIQFRSGGLDVLGISPNNFALLKREEDRGDFTIYDGGVRPGTSFITFNLNTGKRNGQPLVNPIKSRWFNTLEFRQAVSYAVDRQTMINNLFQGLGKPQSSPLSVQSPYFLGPEDGLKTYDYNPDKARELLLSAGFSYDSDERLIDADGHPVRFTLITNTGNKLRESMGAQIKRDLALIGMQVDFQLLDFNTLVQQATNSLDWDSMILGFTGGVEPNNGANVWRTDGRLHMFNQMPGEGEEPLEGRQIADWEERISQLYIQGAQELDEDSRRAIYAETQRLTQEHLPFIYLANSLALAAVRNKIEGIQYSGLYGTLWNINELKITED
ncbi:MAG: ABC transporter substrate-binding protein [Cyanothece sp. SIO2G6]|nr:ABC transporter substrate-binding protein [Cyanothece sp. SIO2G6]